MLKTLAAQIKQYKKSTILTPIFAALEVVMEVLIPMAMARLVKYGIEGGDTGAIYRYGFLMMAMAMLSLVFGSVCAHTASHASTGFAANLRDGMYRNIQRFSFANIDKYSTAGLVTRMTTDVTNVQNAFQMITRIAVRSPLTLIFSMIVAFVINPELAGVFLIPLVLLGVVLGLIIKRATHLFDQVFKKYDDLNASVQENVSGIRVVKAFVREDFEDKKFGKAATNVYNLFVKAERIIAFNSPVMMLTIYGSVMALSWLGASLVTGGSLDVGDLTAMFTYVMNMLMNLMMLSMIFVMLTMSAASARRIVEVLNEEPSLSNPEQPLETVKDGSIDFNHVMFKYHADGNGDPILNDIDLHIKSGETVGIIGGTGCGKSTLMKRLAVKAEQKGEPIQRIHCASDPDSLDGVIFLDKRAAIVDATAPHVMEPDAPGAEEQVVSLYHTLDADALHAHADEVKRLFAQNTALRSRAARYIASAGSLLLDSRRAEACSANFEKVRRYVKRLCARTLPRLPEGASASEELRLLSAITPKGPVFYRGTVQALADRYVVFHDDYGAVSRLLLELIRAEALARGYHIITCPCAMHPDDKIDHLFIPALRLAFLTDNRWHPVQLPGVQAVRCTRFVDRENLAGYRARLRFNERAAAELLEQAADLMAQAKACHDELETYYRAAVDFGKVDEAAAQCAGMLGLA